MSAQISKEEGVSDAASTRLSTSWEATQWSQNKLKTLLENLSVLQSDDLKVNLGEIQRCEGRAEVHHRKNGPKVIFEWTVVVDFFAFAGSEETLITGIATINVDDDDNLDLKVCTKGKQRLGPVEKDILQLLKEDGKIKIRKQLALYVRELMDKFLKKAVPVTDAQPTQHSDKPTLKNYQTLIDVLRNMSPEELELVAIGGTIRQKGQKELGSRKGLVARYKNVDPMDSRSDKKLENWMKTELSRLRSAPPYYTGEKNSVPDVIKENPELVKYWKNLRKKITSIYSAFKKSSNTKKRTGGDGRNEDEQEDVSESEKEEEENPHEIVEQMAPTQGRNREKEAGKAVVDEKNKEGVSRQSQQCDQSKPEVHTSQWNCEQIIGLIRRQTDSENEEEEKGTNSKEFEVNKAPNGCETINETAAGSSGSPISPNPGPEPNGVPRQVGNIQPTCSLSMKCGFEAMHPPAAAVIYENGTDYGAEENETSMDSTLQRLSDASEHVTCQDVPLRTKEGTKEAGDDDAGKTGLDVKEPVDCNKKDGTAAGNKEVRMTTGSCGSPAPFFPEPDHAQMNQQVENLPVFCSKSMTCGFEAQYPPTDRIVTENEFEYGDHEEKPYIQTNIRVDEEDLSDDAMCLGVTPDTKDGKKGRLVKTVNQPMDRKLDVPEEKPAMSEDGAPTAGKLVHEEMSPNCHCKKNMAALYDKIKLLEERLHEMESVVDRVSLLEKMIEKMQSQISNVKK